MLEIVGCMVEQHLMITLDAGHLFSGFCSDLEVYRTKLTSGGRIVFEVAVDYSQVAHTWKEMIRLWVCFLRIMIECVTIATNPFVAPTVSNVVANLK